MNRYEKEGQYEANIIHSIPCYNEEEVLPITKDLFLNKLKELISKEKIQ